MAIDKNTVIKDAQKFAAKGQYGKAIAEWKKLVKEFPNDANVFNTIGDLCLKKEAKADAVDAYKKAADILAADGFTSKAIALYKKVLNIDPKKIEIHLALGDLNAEKGLTGNALESYKLVADHYTKNKEMARALGIYQKMADLNPSNVAFRIKLAEMYAKEGMKKDAIKAYLLAANVHIVKETFQEARQLFEKVLSIDPENKEVYHKAGLVYFKEGKFSEACKALKHAFEADPANEELTDLYLDALAKAGREAEAEEVYRKMLARDPARPDLREKLYRLCVSRKEYGKALAEAVTISDSKLENKDFEAAEEVLKRVVEECPAYVDAHRRLSDFYFKMGRGGDAARQLIRAAELLVSGGDQDKAKQALMRALELVPDMPEARQQLERIQGPSASPEPEAPAPAAASPAAPFPEEDPAVTAALAEVEVLVKYGLAGKAAEQLEQLASQHPKSLQLRMRLRDLYGEQGNFAKAAEHVLALSKLYAVRGMQAEAETELRAALEKDPGNAAIMAKLGLEPAAEAPGPVPSSAPGLAAEEFAFNEPMEESPAATSPEFGSGLDTVLPDAEPAEAPPLPEPVVPEENLFEPPVREVPLERELASEQEFPAPGMPAAEPAALREETPSRQQGLPAGEADISEIWAEAEFYYQQGLFDEARKHYAEILALNPSDRRVIERINEITREQEETQEFSKLADAVEGLESMVPAGEAAGELATTESDEEAVRSLMQEIQQLKQREQEIQIPPRQEDIAAPSVAPAPPQREPSPVEEQQAASYPSGDWDAGESAGDPAGEDLFNLAAELQEEGERASFPKNQEKSEDFFDLAAELRDELSGIPEPVRPAATGEEQSLDDIFEEFKKGVEQQAVKEDIDTHYNLGVSYKEMGLLDDAIAEFMVTPEGEPRFIRSRYMLGLCYMEKGEYQNAIIEIGNALSYSESLAEDQSERIGMLYDLGLAYQGAGNVSEAIIAFQKVHDDDPAYRDVAAKLDELRQGDFISIEQLKDDIEKEISAKFLEEGERIEREEKNRRNEKVRN